MANTQSKYIPYAKDRHRLTSTNVTLATAAETEPLQPSRKQPRSPPSVVQLPGTAAPSALPGRERHTVIPTAL